MTPSRSSASATSRTPARGMLTILSASSGRVHRVVAYRTIAAPPPTMASRIKNREHRIAGDHHRVARARRNGAAAPARRSGSSAARGERGTMLRRSLAKRARIRRAAHFRLRAGDRRAVRPRAADCRPARISPLLLYRICGARTSSHHSFPAASDLLNCIIESTPADQGPECCRIHMWQN